MPMDPGELAHRPQPLTPGPVSLKYIIFLGDGMADYPIPELGSRTPLQVAQKPAMDRIAREGRCGQLVTVEDDMPPGSEVANLTVLGYDPHECYQGRGVIEAASMGVSLTDTDVALRCNLVCIEEERIKNHSAGHISTREAGELIHFLDSKLGNSHVRFYPGISYRHVLVLAQGSTEIECLPPHDHVGEAVQDLMVVAKGDGARPTAALLNSLITRSRHLLPSHPINVRRRQAHKDPANSIWPWSPGHKPKMATFQELYGLTGAVISAVDLIQGLGIYAGLDVIKVPGATGLIDTNFEGKADACLKALRDHDFVYVHVEAADEAGHARDVRQKIQAIERLDERLIARVMRGIERRKVEAVVAVLPDHSTPVAAGNHVRGPVPVAIRDPRARPDSVAGFDEEAVAAGSLGMMHGRQFFQAFLGVRVC
jgi:2,3-bisphosphoglycerate-independent phosphoglycerate mutase